MGKLSEEDIKKMASEKAEKSARDEGIITSLALFTSTSLLTMLVGFGGRRELYISIFFMGLVLALLSYGISKNLTYKKHYKKYVQELTVLRKKSDNK